jgi:hypothetical protein
MCQQLFDWGVGKKQIDTWIANLDTKTINDALLFVCFFTFLISLLLNPNFSKQSKTSLLLLICLCANNSLIGG